MIAPLFTSPSHSDASHSVVAPGGYEWWYFDAEDAEQDVQVVAIILDGFVFHPGYLREHARYLRRPTRSSPAFPRDFPCAYLVVYEKGKLVAQFMTQYPAGSLVASATEPRLTLGSNSLTPAGGGLNLVMAGTPWKLTGRGPQTLHGQTLSADLRLAPVTTHAPDERVFLSREMTGAEHHWVLASPHSQFHANISLSGSAGKTWNLRGLAYHDHNYGTGPLGPGLAKWIWGRALFEDACYTFHHAVPRDSALPPETHLLRIADGKLTDLALTATADWSRQSPLLLRYPNTLRFGDAMTLTNPRVIDPTPFYLRLIYAAECQGRTGTAFCEVAYPHRLRWPVLGRMIEMSFDKRS